MGPRRTSVKPFMWFGVFCLWLLAGLALAAAFGTTAALVVFAFGLIALIGAAASAVFYRRAAGADARLCPECGEAVPTGETRCPRCGRDVPAAAPGAPR